jgi:hypothetical protein
VSTARSGPGLTEGGETENGGEGGCCGGGVCVLFYLRYPRQCIRNGTVCTYLRILEQFVLMQTQRNGCAYLATLCQTHDIRQLNGRMIVNSQLDNFDPTS